MLGAEICVVSQCCAQTAAATSAGLVSTVLLVDVWTDVVVALGEHASHQYVTLGRVEH